MTQLLTYEQQKSNENIFYLREFKNKSDLFDYRGAIGKCPCCMADPLCEQIDVQLDYDTGNCSICTDEYYKEVGY